MFEIFDTIDGYIIDRGLTLDDAIDMLRHYHATRRHCTYGLRPA